MSLFDGIFNGLNGLNGSVGQNLDNNLKTDGIMHPNGETEHASFDRWC